MSRSDCAAVTASVCRVTVVHWQYSSNISQLNMSMTLNEALCRLK